MSESSIRILFDIASQTSIMVLLVLGMAVIVGLMRVFNLCHGELVLLGALTAHFVHSWTGSVLLGMLIAPFVVGLFGLLLERVVIQRFYANPPGALLATFAVGFLIREVVRVNMSAQATTVPAPIDTTVAIGTAHVPAWRLVIIGLTLVILLGCYFALNYTWLGLTVRATLDNPELVSASGTSTASIYAGAYAFGAALAGLAGALIVPLQTLYPNLGLDHLVPLFISVMVGGLGSFEGPLIGTLGIGIPAAALPVWINAVFSQVLVVVGAIVFIRLRSARLRRS